MPTRQPYRAFPRDEDEIVLCPLDKIPVKDHTRCCVCTILIGPGHHMRTPHTIDGKTVCTECRQRLASRADIMPQAR